MFSQALSNTPLTSNQANVYFANRITGESWRNDSSFLATMRALLDSRMPEGDKVSLLFYNNCLAPSAIEQYGDKKAVNSTCLKTPTTSSLFTVSIPVKLALMLVWS